MSTATTMSWEDYQRLPEGTRVEYIDGQAVVNPTPLRRHQHAIVELVHALRAGATRPVIVVPEWGWKPGDDEFVPDVIVTEPTDEQARYTGTPLLVIEVLSSNRAHDLVRKATKYAQVGLPRYWVVDLDVPQITSFTLRAGAYETLAVLTGTDEAEWDSGAGRIRLRPTDLLD